MVYSGSAEADSRFGKEDDVSAAVEIFIAFPCIDGYISRKCEGRIDLSSPENLGSALSLLGTLTLCPTEQGRDRKEARHWNTNTPYYVEYNTPYLKMPPIVHQS